MASPPATSRLTMKPPSSPANYVSRNSKKRMSSGSGSSFMDPEVIEIPPPPPVHRTFRSKQKQPIIHEVIDIDEDEEPSDVMILGIKVDVKAKGKASINSSGSNGNQAKDSFGVTNKAETLKNSGSRSRDLLQADSEFSYDEDYFGYVSDMMEDEDLEMIQAHFDSVDLPTGVEATIPWFPGFSPSKKKAFKGSSSSVDNGMNPFWSFGSSKPSLNNSDTSLQGPANASVHSASLDQPFPFPLLSPPLCPKSESKPTVSKLGGLNLNHPFMQSSLGGFSANANLHTSGPSTNPFTFEPWGFYAPPVHNGGAAGSSSYPDLYSAMSHSMFGSHMSWPFESDPFTGNHNLQGNFFEPTDEVDVSPQEMTDGRNQKVITEEDINKFKLFKKFDTVEDFSDHHYLNTAVKQPSKNWAKKIQDEWRILENDLPDTIFVRVCESRMDLLRAVIIGAEGTPYHDGLFFFDVFFPSSYPRGPPNVHYHSGGLRLNPNLYNCGKVCLSLLNTWSGNKNEKWIPGTSTMLQVLVSIQALILNQKPYFNEPGYARSSGTPHGEIASQQYNEDTLILSLRTMMFTMRKPPKHFEDFVTGHFYHRAHDIMVACKAYLDGAQVGCLVKGGVQDVDEGDKSCSQKFKDSVANCVNLLVKEFALLGVKDCDKFIIKTQPR